jgi:hypothetical protein
MTVTLFGIVIAGGMIAPAPPADRLVGGFVAEFRDIPDGPDAGYHMQMEVTVEGHEKKYAPGIGVGRTDGVGMTGLKLAEFMAFSIRSDDENWSIERDGAKLLIKCWTDPKTGKTYPVKGVRFHTLPIKGAMPDHLLPKVEDRRRKA